MRVERQVVGDERRIAQKERFQPAAQPRVDDERLVAPEEPVVHEHHLRAALDRLLEELAGGRDAAHERRHFLAPDHLHPGRRELRPLRRLEHVVRVTDDLVAVCHGAIL